jgi:hypothetical protein
MYGRRQRVEGRGQRAEGRGQKAEGQDWLIKVSGFGESPNCLGDCYTTERSLFGIGKGDRMVI